MANIELKCTECGTPMSLDAGFAGGVARCSSCGAIVDVPAMSTGEKKAEAKEETGLSAVGTLGQLDVEENDDDGGVDGDNIEQTLAMGEYLGSLFEGKDGFELCAQVIGGDSVIHGYFDDIDKACDYLVKLDKQKTVARICVTLNPVKPECVAKSANKLTKAKTMSTRAEDIQHRRWLPILIEPVRDANLMSSLAEIDNALDVSDLIAEELTDLNWPEPIQCRTGNGVLLLYRVSLPVNDKGMIQRIQDELSSQFGSEQCRIDISLHEANALVEIVGTMVRAGRNLTNVDTGGVERPHRSGEIIITPLGGAEPVDQDAMIDYLASRQEERAEQQEKEQKKAESAAKKAAAQQKQPAQAQAPAASTPSTPSTPSSPAGPSSASTPAPAKTEAQAESKTAPAPQETSRQASAPTSQPAPVASVPAAATPAPQVLLQAPAPVAGYMPPAGEPVDIEVANLNRRLGGTLDLLSEYHRDGAIGMNTGIMPKLDEYTMGLRGLMVIHGRPGAGKTSLATQMGLGVVKQNEDCGFLFISLAMRNTEIERRLIASSTGISWREITLGVRGQKLPKAEDGLRFTEEQRQRYVGGLGQLKNIGDRIAILDRMQVPYINSQTITGAIKAFKRKCLATRVIVVIDALETWPAFQSEDDEAVMKRQMNELLQLSHQGLASSVVVTVGDWRPESKTSELASWMAIPDCVLGIRKDSQQAEECELSIIHGRDGFTPNTWPIKPIMGHFIYQEI